MKLKLSSIVSLVPWLSVLLFALLSWYFLIVRNDDVLYMQQMRSFFNDTPDFLNSFITKPAGCLQWAGCFLTQLFYYPALGAAVLIVMWTAIFFLLKKALCVPDGLSALLLIPLTCLLVSEIDLGYWVYYNTNAGYCFSQTLGMLIVALLLLLYRLIPSSKAMVGIIIRCVVVVLFAALFPLLGIYALLTLVIIGIVEALERRWIPSILSIAFVGVVPLLFKQVYSIQDISSLYTAGLPAFRMVTVTNASLSSPFVYTMAAVVVSVFLYKIGTRLKAGKMSVIVSLLLLVALAGGSCASLKNADYDDANYHAECRAYHAIDEQRWDDALTSIGNVNGTLTRQLIIFKNIALFNTGNIGSRIYDYDDKGMIPVTKDSLQVSMANTAAAMIYLHHGMANQAYRYGMEMQVEFGTNIAALKIMTLAALINGEGKLAEKYLHLLSRTLFHKEWAEHFLPLARNPKLIGKYPELARIHELHSCIENINSTDDDICEYFIVHYFENQSSSQSKYFQEMALVYTMMSKDIEKFWTQYMLYLQLHQGEKVPEVYQQVAYFYAVNKPDMAPDPRENDLRIDQAVAERYNRFNQTIINLVNCGFSESEVGNQTKSEFGNTFWWTYYYNNGVMCY